MYDVIIIGAGPAGMSAAVYARRAGLTCLMLETDMYGGQITTTPEVENYPSVTKISGWELAQNLYEHATSLGAEIAFENVISLIDDRELKTVLTEENAYICKAVIICNGAKRIKLGCDGEERLSGAGVSYCASCDGSFFKGKIAAVVGGGNTALEDALYLANICEKVYLIHRRDEFRASKILCDSVKKCSNINLCLCKTVSGINGENSVESITLKDVTTSEETDILSDCIFVAIGLAPENDIFRDIVELDSKGYIVADESCRTSAEGIFAAGDTRTKELRQIVTACSDGAVAATAAASYINSH